MTTAQNSHRIYEGNVEDCLEQLPVESIDCAITSPPYWGQRDYEFGGQIGNESTHGAYIARLVNVFSVLQKKMTKKGVFFLNIGDKYFSRYGNSYLGLIPFGLAFQMERAGWVLDEILIWYKPNHMPSSIKNRFTNTYEPVFVFSKSRETHHSSYRSSSNQYTNVLRVNLQQTPYNHVAVFPEKLIEALLQRGIPRKAVVLDPFAGSGTVGKAVLNSNNQTPDAENNRSFILIEGYSSYVDIIKKRCGLSSQQVVRVPWRGQSDTSITENDLDFSLISKYYRPNGNEASEFLDGIKNHQKFVRIFESRKEFVKFLQIFISDAFKEIIQDDATIFVGLNEYSLEDLFLLSQISQYGWILRNLIVWVPDRKWVPIFFLVKDTKRVRYRFNLDAILVKHKLNETQDWSKQEFLGLRVLDSMRDKERQRNGVIIKILERYPDEFPKWVLVSWDSGASSNELVIHVNEIEDHIMAVCPFCNEKLLEYYRITAQTSCRACRQPLWVNSESIPIFKEDHAYFTPTNGQVVAVHDSVPKSEKKEYEGKFKHAKKINLGQSPGARSSVQDLAFSTVRICNFPQPMIADYLNFFRQQCQMSKIDLTRAFPPSYKHTVGHWLRKDMGGSIPLPEDWQKLQEILGLPVDFSRLICRCGLKLQAVLKNVKGKNPGDFMEMSYSKLMELFQKV